MNLVDIAYELAPSGLSILIFHRVLRQVDPLLPDLPDAQMFERLIALLAARTDVLPLHEALARLHRGALGRRATAITFDDGYADNHDIAMPILKRHGVTATFFVATAFIDGGIMWNDRIIESIRHTNRSNLDLRELGLGIAATGDVAERRAAISSLLPRLKYRAGKARDDAVNGIVDIADTRQLLPRDLMLSSSQIEAMAAQGMEIGAHTVSHPILALSHESVARSEICTSRERLVDILGMPVRHFAYPNGRPGIDYSLEHVKMVRDAGFDSAVTTSPGVARRGDDMFQLPRFTPWDPPGNRFMLQLARNRLRRPALA